MVFKRKHRWLKYFSHHISDSTSYLYRLKSDVFKKISKLKGFDKLLSATIEVELNDYLLMPWGFSYLSKRFRVSGRRVTVRIRCVFKDGTFIIRSKSSFDASEEGIARLISETSVIGTLPDNFFELINVIESNITSPTSQDLKTP